MKSRYTIVALFVFGLFVLTVILLTTSVSGKLITVDDDEEADFLSIQEAADFAESGDTISIREGIYGELVVVNKTLDIQGAGPNETIMDATRFQINRPLLTIKAAWVNISGFRIVYNDTWHFACGIATESNHSTIRNCTFESNGIMVLGNFSSIENCTFEKGGINGGWHYSPLHNITIRDSRFLNSNRLDLYSMENITMTGNLFVRTGVWISSFNTTFRNNHFLEEGFSVTSTEPFLFESLELDSSNTVNDKPVYFHYQLKDKVISAGGGQLILAFCEDLTVRGHEYSNVSVGVTVVSSSNIILRENTFLNSTSGIDVEASGNITIVKNYCSRNEVGIRVWGAYSPRDFILVENNSCIFNTENGISLRSVNATVRENICQNNGYSGMSLVITNSTVSGNNCSGNRYGIFLGGDYDKSGDFNKVSGNTCNFNKDKGISLNPGVDDSIITGNNCSGNKHGIYISLYTKGNVIGQNSLNQNTYGLTVNYCETKDESRKRNDFGNNHFSDNRKNINYEDNCCCHGGVLDLLCGLFASGLGCLLIFGCAVLLPLGESIYEKMRRFRARRKT